MSKAFTSEETEVEDAERPDEPPPLPPGTKNYMTPEGAAALREELRFLLKDERPRIVEIVSWAAGNGDRSENGDYLYNKKRLREIDRRVRYLTKRLDKVEIVDPRRQQTLEQVFFGATVTYARADGTKQTVKLVDIDEADMAHGKINWQSPVARALMKKREGDRVELRTGGGIETLEILAIDYVTGD
ncbi:MAG: transcription elongation factor GreB [Rhodospirillales bacterium]|nr:transcription elongation factor GreB [Alphaproteobacteria bacterium]MCB9986173.1 transcription elongation factor GreB [Rhodospirillales bacterium]USO07270.1 MAG: transcription elongation factor GreB [Rhodospirillales bacterium]